MDSNQEAANFAQIENTRLSRKLVNIGYATLGVCAIGTVFAAWAVLRSPDTSQAPPTGGGSMINWIWIPAIILGTCSLLLAAALLIVAFKQWRYKKLSKRTAQLQNDLAQAMTDLEHEQSKPKSVLASGEIENFKAQLEADKARITDLVRVCAVYYVPQFNVNDRLQTFIDFTFYIFNNSLHDIVTSETLPGYIQFGTLGDRFSRACEIESKKPTLCRARGDCRVTVRQYVDKHEIDLIEAADNMYFWFEHLGTTFKLAKEPQGEGIALRTNQTVETKKGLWHIYDIPEYVFALNDEQWAEAIKGKSIEMVKETTELKIDLAAVKAERDVLRSKVDELTKHGLLLDVDLEPHTSNTSQKVRSRLYVSYDALNTASVENEPYLIKGFLRIRFDNHVGVATGVRSLTVCLRRETDQGAREARLTFEACEEQTRAKADLALQIIQAAQISPCYELDCEGELEKDWGKLLDENCFLRIKMEAAGQPPYCVDLNVDWQTARLTDSPAFFTPRRAGECKNIN
jgi:hypothetical protein